MAAHRRGSVSSRTNDPIYLVLSGYAQQLGGRFGHARQTCASWIRPTWRRTTECRRSSAAFCHEERDAGLRPLPYGITAGRRKLLGYRITVQQENDSHQKRNRQQERHERWHSCTFSLHPTRIRKGRLALPWNNSHPVYWIQDVTGAFSAHAARPAPAALLPPRLAFRDQVGRLPRAAVL